VGALSPGIKHLGHKAYHTSQVKKEGSYATVPPLPLYAFMAYTYKDNFTCFTCTILHAHKITYIEIRSKENKSVIRRQRSKM